MCLCVESRTMQFNLLPHITSSYVGACDRMTDGLPHAEETHAALEGPEGRWDLEWPAADSSTSGSHIQFDQQ